MRFLHFMAVLCLPFIAIGQQDSSTLVIKENADGLIMIDYSEGGSFGPNKQNVFLGEEAGLNTTGFGNLFIGRLAGRENTTGFSNTYIGKSAGENALGTVNTFVGNQSGQDVTGERNVLIGNSAGKLLNGNLNVSIGEEAGENLTGSNNVLIGPLSGENGQGDNNLFLGNHSGRNQGGSNQLIIENSDSDSTETLIYGQFDNDILRFNAHTDIYSDNSVDEGLYVEKTHTGNSDIPAIRGINTVADFYGVGVLGQGGWKGLEGISNGTGSGSYFGTYSYSTGTNTGLNYGIFGFAANGQTNYAVYGQSNGGTNNFAGFFQGQVKIIQNVNDNIYFQVENNLGENVISIGDNDVVEVNRFKTNWFTEMDSLKTNWYTELTNVTSTGNTSLSNVTTNGSTDIEIESGKRINRATSMKYFIATTGSFPTTEINVDGILIGEIKLFPYNFTPGGWLPCEGQILNIADHAALFSLIGTNYGGNGTTTFALPDMREAVPHHN